MDLEFTQVMEWVTMAIEAIGVAILALGTVWVLVAYLPKAVASGHDAYQDLRHQLGRVILVGLEVLIVADIVQTVTVEFSLESVALLGLIVVVRTFLSFSLEIELDGVAPWKRYRVRGEE